MQGLVWSVFGQIPLTHAHNDYLHPRPLQDALAQDFISVEADILLSDGNLFVGHDREDLVNKPLIDLESVYLRPLFERFKANGKNIYPGYQGLFYLWIDIKYDGETVLSILKDVIRPYRKMLFSGRKNKAGKVMLIISGERPMDLLLTDPGGYFHIDGRPSDLEKMIDSGRMPFISQSMRQVCVPNAEGYLDDGEYQKLVELVDRCHNQGKKVRLWASPENERLWQQLKDANVDLINTDALVRLADFLVR
jgi:hypothetical protein